MRGEADSDVWLASMRHITVESGAFVVSVPHFIPGDCVPGRLPGSPSCGQGCVRPGWGSGNRADLGRGDSDCDLRRGLHANRWFDAVGHHGREDVLVREASGPTESIAVDLGEGGPLPDEGVLGR